MNIKDRSLAITLILVKVLIPIFRHVVMAPFIKNTKKVLIQIIHSLRAKTSLNLPLLKMAK